MFYHENLDVRGGAEVVFQYLLKFSEKKLNPYLVLTLSKIDTFSYNNKLVKLRRNRFLSFNNIIYSNRILYKRLPYLVKAFYNVRKRYGKPKFIFITKGGFQPLYLGLFGCVFKDVKIKILSLPDIHQLNILTGNYGKHKISLLPARFLSKTLLKLHNFNDAYFLANSPEMRELILKVFPSLKGRVDVLYPPFDDKFFYPRNDLREDNSILVVGRIHPSKRTHLALEVFRNLREYVKDVKLYIVGDVGDKSYYGYLCSKIATMNLQNHVEVIPEGEPEILREYMWRSKVCWCIASGFFGITNVECLACGAIPIVLPGFKSSVGSFGFVASNQDDFVKFTVKVLANPPSWEKILEGYKWVRNMFSSEAFFKRTSEIFQKLGILYP